ncbi:hypothetical protein [Streptomyces sp. NPDC055036]
MGLSVWPAPENSGVVGATGATGPAGAKGDKGDSGLIQSVNGKSAAQITLSAVDVNALPNSGNAQLQGQYFWLDRPAGTYRAFGYKSDGVDRWLFQVDDTAETGANNGSHFRMSARNDDGSFSRTVMYARRDSGQVAFLTAVPHGSAAVTVNGSVALKDVVADPATVAGGVFLYSKGGLPYVKQADGSVLQVGGGGGTVSSVNSKTGAVTITLDELGGIPASQKAAASGVATLDASTRLPAAQMPTTAPRNVWTPQALGFQAWSVDPASVAAPTLGRAVTIGRTYYAGIYITEPTTVSKVAILAAGWAGSTTIPAARFFAGIYNEAGTRVAHSGTTALSNIEAAGQTSGTPTSVRNSHAGAVAFPLSTAVTLQPGRYWASWQMSAGQATDLYYFHVQNESGANPSIFNLLPTAFVRNAYIEGLSGVPTSINKTNMLVNHDQIIMALAT